MYRELRKYIPKKENSSGAGIISQKLKEAIFFAELSFNLHLEALHYSKAVTSNQ